MKSRVRTGLTLLGILLGLGLVLFGCEGGKPSSGASSSDTTAPAGNSASGGSPLSPIDITVMKSLHAGYVSQKDAPARGLIFEKTGVRVNLQGIPASDYDTKSKTLLATNQLPDVMQIGTDDVQNYASSGIFLDITPYLDKYAPNFKKVMANLPDIKKIMINGKLYGFPLTTRAQVFNAQAPMIRQDILDELHVPTPKTFDELFEVLKKVKEKYPNSYPWTMRNGSKKNLPFLAYAMGSGYTIYYEPKTDSYKYGPAHPEFANVLSYLNKLYAAKVLDPNFANNTQQQWIQNLVSGKSVFYFDNMQYGLNNILDAAQSANPKAQFALLPVLADQNGQRRMYMYNINKLSGQFVINAKIKNPERIVSMFDWMYSQEGTDITNFGVPGTNFVRQGDQIEFTQATKDLLEKYKDKQDVFFAITSDLGVGPQEFMINLDDHLQRLTSAPILVQFSDALEKQYKDGLIQPDEVSLPFNDQEIEQLKQLTVKLNTMVEQVEDKYIMGSEPLANYNDFARKLMDQGAAQMEKIYNDAYTRVKNQ